MTSNQSEYIKFIVIGSSGVGKTSILTRLVSGTFSDDTASTVGVEFVSAEVNVDGKSVKLQIWDTAGQERFRSIAKNYFHSAVGVILVFDLTERKSFDDLGQWLEDVHQHCEQDTVVVLVGNKCDMTDERCISENEAKSFAEMHKFEYFETSALCGDNIEYTFQSTAASALKIAESRKVSYDNVVLTNEPKESGCC
ncbi:small GTP-binding protein [Tritrichomonas foetus]|uniref:Small GTP-binding protein n=1 Tax=Tritrichomonas foetus TaxID=1144522 RepID=A0A1J4KE25_9EUKA|nr:small GTP-binding protein [Tritrichomonas foetus]|eukprot:OHT09160.1 small GTP-binding protein [Tritrichomonas foetus]